MHFPIEVVAADKIGVSADLTLTATVDGNDAVDTTAFPPLTKLAGQNLTITDRFQQGGTMAMGFIGVMGGAAGLALILAGARRVFESLGRRRRPATAQEDGPSNGYL
jgi:hypothetical protein